MVKVLSKGSSTYYTKPENSLYINDRGIWVDAIGNRTSVLMSELEAINSDAFQAKLALIEKLYNLSKGSIMKNMPDVINDLY